MSQPRLTSQPQAQAERIERALVQARRDDVRRMTELLASQEDRHLLGKTEFQLRDLGHHSAATAFETALRERKRGGTRDRA